MNPALRILLLGGGPFTPQRLFRAGEQGFFFVNDISTMYQDSAGTTPAAVDQPVGKWLDVSGRGNHATQATSANRPTLKQDARGNYYVHFNGTNQWMQIGSIDFTGTDKMTVFAGVTKLSDAARGMLLELGGGGLNSFSLNAPNGAGGNNFVFATGGSIGGAGQATVVVGAAPYSSVVTAVGDIAGRVASIRANGVAGNSSSADQGSGAYSNAVIYLGARSGSSLFFNGDIYCIGARGAPTTDTLIAQAERYVAARMGLSL